MRRGVGTIAKEQRKKGRTIEPAVPRIKDFLDMIAPLPKQNPF